MRASTIKKHGVALAFVFVGAVSALACAGVNPATMGLGAADGESCRMNSDGTQTCGYNCVMGSDGRHACASTPEGSCVLLASGQASCDSGPASGSNPPADSIQPAGDTAGSSDSGDVEATCCVNKAFFDCPSVRDAAICVGEPMELMQCLNACDPMSSGSSCEDACIEEHGPKPEDSECERAPARDNECSR